MKQNFNTRIKKGLFPEMPQSFADGLQRAAAACGSQNTRTESTSAIGSEPKKRRFPVGKVLAGAAAAANPGPAEWGHPNRGPQKAV